MANGALSGMIQGGLPAALQVNFLVSRCIGADDVGEGKGLILRPSDLCGLLRRKDTSAHAAEHSLALLLVWI